MNDQPVANRRSAGPTKTPGIVAACLCFRDSAAYLHEWLLFHAVQGVGRFYLYDNESRDDYVPVLQPWINAGWVRLRCWPGLAQQQAIYDHCLAAVDDDVAWLAFIDDDEFLYACDGSPLPKTLEQYAMHAGVAICWMLFGSSGHTHAGAGWVIERFQRCANAPDPHVKCVVQPRWIARSRIVGHAFEPKVGTAIVDEHGRLMRGPFAAQPSCDVLRINHYIVKSWHELIERRFGRPDVATGRPKEHSLAQWRQWDGWWCTTLDTSALQFVPAMEKLDGKLRSQPCAAEQTVVSFTPGAQCVPGDVFRRNTEIPP